MSSSYLDVLRNQGRGVTGALLVVGLALLYTMETWWLAWRLPMVYLLAYALGGLAAVFVIVRNVGFRQEEQDQAQENLWRVATNFAELVLQSFLAAYLVLLLLGVVEVTDSLVTVVRMGLIQVVPLGFGAALANQLLAASEGETEESTFPKNVGLFALGAAFVVFPLSPVEEVELIAVHADWGRLALLVLVSVGVVDLVLHELDFRGQSGRIEGVSELVQFGTAAAAYVVAVAVSTALLAAFGHFAETTVLEWVQQIIVLSFPASVGASAAEVVL